MGYIFNRGFRVGPTQLDAIGADNGDRPIALTLD